ncbi:MAG: helix-turn-helix transcriptional regulator [Clostridia bacterium]|jgi:putative transcriptional regulator|nr:helix-turn-helix transcriptional regulator [Clostridia bacterium]
MVIINVEELLRKQGKSKYWLCQKMDITNRNLNQIINGKTKSISFRYIEEFCKYLECTPAELILIEKEEKK